MKLAQAIFRRVLAFDHAVARHGLDGLHADLPSLMATIQQPGLRLRICRSLLQHLQNLRPSAPVKQEPRRTDQAILNGEPFDGRNRARWGVRDEVVDDAHLVPVGEDLLDLIVEQDRREPLEPLNKVGRAANGHDISRQLGVGVYECGKLLEPFVTDRLDIGQSQIRVSQGSWHTSRPFLSSRLNTADCRARASFLVRDFPPALIARDESRFMDLTNSVRRKRNPDQSSSMAI